MSASIVLQNQNHANPKTKKGPFVEGPFKTSTHGNGVYCLPPNSIHTWKILHRKNHQNHSITDAAHTMSDTDNTVTPRRLILVRHAITVGPFLKLLQHMHSTRNALLTSNLYLDEISKIIDLPNVDPSKPLNKPLMLKISDEQIKLIHRFLTQETDILSDITQGKNNFFMDRDSIENSGAWHLIKTANLLFERLGLDHSDSEDVLPNFVEHIGTGYYPESKGDISPLKTSMLTNTTTVGLLRYEELQCLIDMIRASNDFQDFDVLDAIIPPPEIRALTKTQNGKETQFGPVWRKTQPLTEGYILELPYSIDPKTGKIIAIPNEASILHPNAQPLPHAWSAQDAWPTEFIRTAITGNSDTDYYGYYRTQLETFQRSMSH
jgi:hypothetical protein